MSDLQNQIKATQEEIRVHAETLNRFGTQVGGTPQSIAKFSKLLSLLSEQANVSAAQNEKTARIGVRIAWLALFVSIFALAAQILQIVVDHSKSDVAQVQTINPKPNAK